MAKLTKETFFQRLYMLAKKRQAEKAAEKKPVKEAPASEKAAYKQLTEARDRRDKKMSLLEREKENKPRDRRRMRGARKTTRGKGITFGV